MARIAADIFREAGVSMEDEVILWHGAGALDSMWHGAAAVVSMCHWSY